MHYTGITYRPPFEAQSLLLQVTAGCSHNRCAFCTMYRDVPFAVEPMEQIDADLEEASAYADRITRVFLENGDAFVLNAPRLLEIAERIHFYLPQVETIAMYASVKNIENKTDEELVRLRAAGINELNIGLESGFDPVLSRMQKGYTADEARTELLRLKEAGIDWGANVIFGAAGAGSGIQNAEATARLLNETAPYLIFTGTVHADPGCPLYEDMQSGRFVESTFGEYLDEQERFLSLLQLDPCFYFGLHPSNILPMQGWLLQDRDVLIDAIRSKRRAFAARIHEKPQRGAEGSVRNR